MKHWRFYLIIWFSSLFVCLLALFTISHFEKINQNKFFESIKLTILNEEGFSNTYNFLRRMESLSSLSAIKCILIIKKIERDNSLNVFDTREKDNCLISDYPQYKVEVNNHIGDIFEVWLDIPSSESYRTQKYFSVFLILIISAALTLIYKIRFSAFDERHYQKTLLIDQVVHDVKSPLILLKEFSRNSILSNQSEKLVRKSIDMIEGMIISLKDDQKTSVQSYSIISVINEVIKEKEIEFGIKINLQVSASQSFVNIALFPLKRIISNIINNAIESVNKRPPEISILISSDENYIVLNISDNGDGFSNEAKKLFGKRHFSSKGKNRGLGISGALSTLSEWNSSLQIVKTSSEGSTLELKLPHTCAPFKCQQFILVKTDTLPVKVLVESNSTLTIPRDSIITTDHYDPTVEKQAYENNSIYTLDSIYLSLPILNVKRLIHIEDNKYIRSHWKSKAFSNGIAYVGLSTFSPETMPLSEEGDVIFVDKNLNDSKNGEEIALILFKKGYENIFFATGETNYDRIKLPFIKGIIGKDFPIII